MNVKLRLVHDKIIPHRVDAPCKGLTAKALGKYKLEEDTGLVVKFVSYQEGDGRPEKPLADDENIQRGAILNFAVNIDNLLKEQKHHKELLQGLYHSKLLSLIAKFSCRLVSPVVQEEDIHSRTGVTDLFNSSKERAAAATTALAAVGSSISAATFAASLDNAYVARNKDQHVNTDQQLEQEFKIMRKAGVVRLMEADYPVECTIVDHYEVFMQLLPNACTEGQ